MLNANPIVLNARGECILWLAQEQEYRLILKTPTGTTVITMDDVAGAQSVPVNFPPALTSQTGHAGPLVTNGTTASWLDGPMASRNRIINGGFNVNVQAVSGTIVLAANAYGHDRWKAGASGCTYTVATASGLTTATISAGSLRQIIEGGSVPHGANQCTLSWAGTATGRIGTEAFAASPTTASVTGGADVAVEFGIGTIANVQFELGTVATPFEQRMLPVEHDLCARYHQRVGALLAQWGHIDTGGHLGTTIWYPVVMRTAPSVASVVGTFDVLNVSQPTLTNISATGCSWECTATGTGPAFLGSPSTAVFFDLFAEL